MSGEGNSLSEWRGEEEQCNKQRTTVPLTSFAPTSLMNIRKRQFDISDGHYSNFVHSIPYRYDIDILDFHVYHTLLTYK